MLRLVKIVALLVLVGLALYIRFAPAQVERWHRIPEAAEAGVPTVGTIRVVKAGAGDFRRLHGIITETRRTRIFAGAVADGMVTYVTRSLIFGFPDYTTVRQDEGSIVIYGRQRFGRSDFGVNAARIEGWLERFAQGG